ncbi:hypothetical protein PVAP13_9NG321473 [Panicum virgatum]|uniref:Uncharacterized protein n=1 Tax=Panicum virgatum TaxID=38727 RepID=A0A8T0MMF9_PANVG|nr:hypothetical protein PVAP13_9NG321473 [Panicum virgatum]
MPEEQESITMSSARVGSPPWERKSVGEGEGAARALLGSRRSRPEGPASPPCAPRPPAPGEEELRPLLCRVARRNPLLAPSVNAPRCPLSCPLAHRLESAAPPPPADSITGRGDEAT